MDDPYMKIQMAQAAISVLALLTVYWATTGAGRGGGGGGDGGMVSEEVAQKYKHL